MRRYLVVLVLSVCSFSFANAGENKEHKIDWLTFEQAEAKMKEKPKKVIVDVYTSWCGWCKKLDKDVYSNDSAIAYINEHFYAIKFDAEQKTPINFTGIIWNYSPEKKVNDLAVALYQGQGMSYPTTIFMDEGFKQAQPIPGYLALYQMEGILKYFGGDYNHKQDYQEWQHNFKPSWKPQG